VGFQADVFRPLRASDSLQATNYTYDLWDSVAIEHAPRIRNFNIQASPSIPERLSYCSASDVAYALVRAAPTLVSSPEPFNDTYGSNGKLATPRASRSSTPTTATFDSRKSSATRRLETRRSR
jgi:hypothetical protein